jgi:ABC-2 type transport system ATP-binding protein
MSSTPVIQTRDLTRYYGTTVGVEGLELEIRPGEIFGFLGPNGAGKTTTIRLLLDLIRPTRGEAFLFGDPSSRPGHRSRIGHLPGELSLDGRMSGKETLDFLTALDGTGGSEGKRARRNLLCERLGLSGLDLERKVREYSRGMKQKLGLVAAFQHRPELLVLDEPTTGLDPLVREVVFELMAEAREEGATVFHSSHVLSEVDRTCDRVGVLREGRLAALLSVHEARQASVRRMSVEFEGAPPLEALRAAGAQVESTSGQQVELRVTGEIQPLLRVLARIPVRHLSFPEPTLEEAFNSFYREPGVDEPSGPVGEGVADIQPEEGGAP